MTHRRLHRQALTVGLALLQLAVLVGCAADEPPGARRRAAMRAPAGSIRNAAPRPAGPVVPAERPSVLVAGEQQGSLRLALAGAQEGDVIQLGPGVHEGPLDVEVSVQIVGMAGTVIESSTPSCLRVRAGVSAILSNVTVRAHGIHRQGAEATVIVVDGILRMTGCTITAARAGALNAFGSEIELTDTDVISETWQSCIMLSNGSRATIRGGEFVSHGSPGSGIELWESYLDVTDASIDAVGPAIVVTEESELLAHDTTLQGRFGLWSRNGGRSELTDCVLQLCRTAGARVEGLVELNRCTITRNEAGLLLVGAAAQLTLRSCTLSANTEQVLVEDAIASQIRLVDTTL